MSRQGSNNIPLVIIWLLENVNFLCSVSGTGLRQRNEFFRLMQAARDGKVDLIITKSLSRFGRNTLDCLTNIRELKALFVDVYFEQENVHILRSEGEMLLTLIAAVA